MNGSPPPNGAVESARAAILSRIRHALGDRAPGRAGSIARPYRTFDPSPRAAILDQFVERVSEYKATVRRVSAAALPQAIADACAARHVRTLAVPADLPPAWLAGVEAAGITLRRDPGLSHHDLETSDGVMTGCALSIAQTGTIVLDAGPAQGRRVLSLLPDYHLCIIRADQVVGLVPEAIARLHPVMTAPGHPLTFISGPSATSDIELNRVEGVHGPRTLEVLVMMEF